MTARRQPCRPWVPAAAVAATASMRRARGSACQSMMAMVMQEAKTMIWVFTMTPTKSRAARMRMSAQETTWGTPLDERLDVVESRSRAAWDWATHPSPSRSHSSPWAPPTLGNPAWTDGSEEACWPPSSPSSPRRATRRVRRWCFRCGVCISPEFNPRLHQVCASRTATRSKKLATKKSYQIKEARNHQKDDKATRASKLTHPSPPRRLLAHLRRHTAAAMLGRPFALRGHCPARTPGAHRRRCVTKLLANAALRGRWPTSSLAWSHVLHRRCPNSSRAP